MIEVEVLLLKLKIGAKVIQFLKTNKKSGGAFCHETAVRGDLHGRARRI